MASLLSLVSLTPLNVALLVLLAVVLLSLLSPLFASLSPPSPLPSTPHTSYNWRPSPPSPALFWQAYTPASLSKYDGTPTGAEGGARILFAIRRKVYDVSTGRSFYGPGGPYAIFAGRDASRGLAKQSFEEEMLTKLEERIDDLVDLGKADWDNLRDWEGHFGSKYILCGDFVEPN